MTTEFHDICAAAADRAALRAKASARAGLCLTFRLYYEPCTPTRCGRVALVADGCTSPAGFVRASGVPALSPAIAYDQYLRWTMEHASNLTLLCPTAA